MTKYVVEVVGRFQGTTVLGCQLCSFMNAEEKNMVQEGSEDVCEICI